MSCCHHRRAWAWLTLLAMSMLCTPVLAAGTVIAMGGAVRPDHAALWSRVVQAAGGPGAKVLVLATASAEPDAAAARLVDSLRRHGADAEALPVAGAQAREAAHDPRWVARVAQAGGVFFSGGDQRLIVEALAPGGVDSPLMSAVRALLARGGVVAGTSAGAAIASERMFLGGEPIDVLRDHGGPFIGAGLGLLRRDLLVDQHFLRRGRVGRLVPALWRSGLPLGLGVEEDSAIVVQGDRVEAIGARGALLVDLRAARPWPGSAAHPGRFGLFGARLSYLDDGDTLDLATLEITPSTAKRSGRRVGEGHEGWRPYYPARAFYADMLGDFTIVSAMQHLVDSRASEVIGLAFDGLAADPAELAEQGFEWRLTRHAHSAAWSVGDRYTIRSVTLDITPVRIQRPLYLPLH